MSVRTGDYEEAAEKILAATPGAKGVVIIVMNGDGKYRLGVQAQIPPKSLPKLFRRIAKELEEHGFGP